MKFSAPFLAFFAVLAALPAFAENPKPETPAAFSIAQDDNKNDIGNAFGLTEAKPVAAQAATPDAAAGGSDDVFDLLPPDEKNAKAAMETKAKPVDVKADAAAIAATKATDAKTSAITISTTAPTIKPVIIGTAAPAAIGTATKPSAITISSTAPAIKPVIIGTAAPAAIGTAAKPAAGALGTATAGTATKSIDVKTIAPATIPSTTPAAASKTDVKTETKTETKAETKTETKTEAKATAKTTGLPATPEAVAAPPAAPAPVPPPPPPAKLPTGPTADYSKTLFGVAESSEKFKTFLRLVTAAHMDVMLKGKGAYTVFAPNDAAFDKLGKAKIARLLEPDNAGDLNTLLTYHIVNAKLDIEKFKGKTAAPNVAQGAELKIDYTKGEPKIESAEILKTDIGATNGNLEEINAVLLPPSVQKLFGSAAKPKEDDSADTSEEKSAPALEQPKPAPKKKGWFD